MYYGQYDDTGSYVGFYSLEFHGGNIPTPNIGLTEKEWQQALTGSYKVINGRHTYSPPEPNKDEPSANQLTALDDEYSSQFAALVQALGLASLDNNTTLISELQAEYTELKKEYQQEREAVLNND